MTDRETETQRQEQRKKQKRTGEAEREREREKAERKREEGREGGRVTCGVWDLGHIGDKDRDKATEIAHDPETMERLSQLVSTR